MYWRLVETAWGYAGVVGHSDEMVYVGFPEASEAEAINELVLVLGTLPVFSPDAFPVQTEQIAAYFEGEPIRWHDFRIRLTGSPFQIRVWEETRLIPHGHTATYGDIARLAGVPRAARAAGSALAANGAGLLVPCHRVVAAGGIGGYGSRPDRKRALLHLERATTERQGNHDGGHV